MTNTIKPQSGTLGPHYLRILEVTASPFWQDTMQVVMIRHGKALGRVAILVNARVLKGIEEKRRGEL
jgi:hypothetical protein